MMMVLIILSVMVSIGFFTLLERKILSLSQNRLGPNKVLIMGIIQPILDGLKLFTKTNITPISSFFLLFYMISFMMMMISFMLWLCFPFFVFENKILNMLWLLMIFGIMSYLILLMGWCSMNKYSFFGSIRSLSQTLSFEILLMIVMSLVFMIKNKFSFSMEDNYSLISVIIMVSFFIMILLESQRSPFDLSEGESELVSGYNIELGSVLFTFTFLGEYNSMIFLSMMLTIMFVKSTMLLMISMLYLILLIRTCFPRVRYDKLMYFCWMKILPVLIMIWFLYFTLKFW